MNQRDTPTSRQGRVAGNGFDMPDPNISVPYGKANVGDTCDSLPSAPRPSLTGPGLGQIVAVLRAEMERGWSEGRPLLLEDYLDLLTQTGASEDDRIELLFAEVYLRERHGEKPTVDEYLRRFPQLAERIVHQFGLMGVQASNRAHAPVTAASAVHTSSSVSLFSPPPAPSNDSVQPPRANATPTRRIRAGAPQPPKASGGYPQPEVDIPGYEILGELGRGGMGIVYKAMQKGLSRLVALKMILAGKKGNDELHARFMREAESVARLRHPNIVQVYEIGEHEGRPFLTLEFVDGGTLDQLIDGKPQPADFAAQMAEQIARAVHHAHENGVVHRDLKPSNILVSRGPNSPDPERASNGASARTWQAGSWTPKITDFGLAKQLDNHDALTATHAVAGTPAYMAPEQVFAGKKQQVGPQSDVWAVGVILYELLTGRAPFLADTPLEMMRLVANAEPVPPSRLQPRTPRDLETICLRCLQKDPFKRYASARELADDLASFRESKPIIARPVGVFEQAWGWCRRNPTVAALLFGIGLTLILGAGAATFFAVRASDQAQRAEQKSRDADRSAKEAVRAREEEKRLNRDALRREEQRGRELYAARMNLARRDWEAGRVGRARQVLDSYLPARHGGPDIRGFEWFMLERLCKLESIRFDVPGAGGVAVSTDGELIAWCTAEAAEVWSLKTRKRVWKLRAGSSAVRFAAFDPTGALIATASADGSVRLWDAKSGTLTRELNGATQSPAGLAFASDGRRLARSGRTADGTAGELHVWDVKTGGLVVTHAKDLPGLRGIALGPAAKWLAASAGDGTVRLWDASGESIASLSPRGMTAVSVAASPNGALLAFGTSEGAILIWDVATTREIARMTGHRGEVGAVGFAADGVTLASAGDDGVIRIWDTSRSMQVRQFPGHADSVTELTFGKSASTIYTASRDGTVRVWDVAREPEYWSLKQAGLAAGQHPLAGGRFAAVSALGEVLVAEIAGRRTTPFVAPLGATRTGIKTSALSADGATLIVCTDNDQIYRVGIGEKRSAPLKLSRIKPDVRGMSCAPDGERFATVHGDGTVQIHRFDDTTIPIELRLSAAAFSTVAFHPKDSTRVAAGAADGTVVLWELPSAKTIFAGRGHSAAVRSVAFSPDGKLIATASDDASVKLWNAVAVDGSSPERLSFDGHAAAVLSVAFSPSGDRLVSGSADRTAKIWDVETGQETLTLAGHVRRIVSSVFSLDGRALFTRGEDGEIRVWESSSTRDSSRPLREQ